MNELIKILLRMQVGQMRPVSFAHTPPGATANWTLLPITLLMLVWSLWSASRYEEKQA